MVHLSGGNRGHLWRWRIALKYAPAAGCWRPLAVRQPVAACRRGLHDSWRPGRASPLSSGGWVACQPALAALDPRGPRHTGPDTAGLLRWNKSEAGSAAHSRRAVTPSKHDLSPVRCTSRSR